MSEIAARANLFRLALPLLLNSLMGLITTFVDTLIISKHSDSAAAAVSLANQILMVAYDLSLMMSVGGAILISYAVGKGRFNQAANIARIAVLSNFFWGGIIGAVMFVSAPILVDLINTPNEAKIETLRYIQVVSLAIPFNGFLMASVASLRAFSQVKAIFLLGIVAFPSYLILNYILVLGVGNIPSLGATGSALATLLVRLGSVAVLIFLLPKVISLNWQLRIHKRWSVALVRKMMKLASPSVLDNVAYGFYQLVLLSFIAGLGVVAVISRFYVIALTAFLPVVVMAISQANEVLVGYRVGAKNTKSVGALVWRSGCWSAAIATAFSILLYAVSEPLVSLFSQDPEVYALTQELLLLTIVIQPLTGLNTVLFHSLRMTGDVHSPVIFSQIVMWGAAVPAAYWFSVVCGYGVAGLWYAMILEELAKTVYMIVRWRRQTSTVLRIQVQSI